ncbi:MAG TPA: Dabb family protein [Haloplasmataceae bacterium]
MIKHIVMWKLKEDCKDKGMSIKEKLENLQKIIPYVIKIEVGINILDSSQAYDVVLYSEFNNTDDLNRYQNHEEHLLVVDFIKSVTEKRIVVDYEV